jgi:thymidylate synthase (FAD)
MEKSVKLIGITKPVHPDPDFQPYTSEQLIAYCARVSNTANQDNPDSNKLLKYLVRNKHWSPFEMVHVVMEINTTRDIARQILRHRSFSFQEFSQRYAEVTNDSFQIREARMQDTKNRQNSVEIDHYVDEQVDLDKSWRMKQQQMQHEAQLAYKWAIEKGIAKEVARSVLPEGLTMSRMYMSGSLRSWIHYCHLRIGNGTQKEHRLIAEECWNVLCDQFGFLEGLLDDNP